MRVRIVAAVSIALGSWAVTLQAHDPGLSALELQVDEAVVRAQLSLSLQDAARAIDVDAISTAPGRHEADSIRLASMAETSIELMRGATRLVGRVDGVTIARDGVSIRLTYAASGGSILAVQSRLVETLAGGHRQLLTVKAADGTTIVQEMLGGGGRAATDITVKVNREATARRFFALGLEHILTGYDHLLFLAGLLLGVPRLRGAAATATAFTAGHSMTLAASVIGVMHVPSRVIEPLIAASLVYVGIENVARPGSKARWVTAALFGLVHGFGFAGALRELGVGASGLAVGVPLGSFNAGVEAGQMAVAIVLWPIIRAMRARPAVHARLAPACSLLVALAGAGWCVARLL
jgi:hydrogenase/urease accessory protein HupE